MSCPPPVSIAGTVLSSPDQHSVNLPGKTEPEIELSTGRCWRYENPDSRSAGTGAGAGTQVSFRNRNEMETIKNTPARGGRGRNRASDVPDLWVKPWYSRASSAGSSRLYPRRCRLLVQPGDILFVVSHDNFALELQ